MAKKKKQYNFIRISIGTICVLAFLGAMTLGYYNKNKSDRIESEMAKIDELKKETKGLQVESSGIGGGLNFFPVWYPDEGISSSINGAFLVDPTWGIGSSTSRIFSAFFTNASTTNLTVTGITGSTQCLQVDTTGKVSGSGGACGAAAGSGDPFAWTPSTNYNENTSATSTPVWFQDSIYASSTSFFDGLLIAKNASSTFLSGTNLSLSGLFNITGNATSTIADDLSITGFATSTWLGQGGGLYFGFGKETLNQWTVDVANKGVMDTITVTDEGGTNVSWTVGEIYDKANALIVDTTASGSTGTTNDNINYLKWVSGSGLTLNTTAPSGNEIAVAVINVQDGDIWDVHTDSLINVRESGIETGLANTFPIVVTSGMVVSEDTDVTYAFDVQISSGIYYHDVHEEHIVPATTTRLADIRIWCGGDVYLTGVEITEDSWCDSGSMASTTASKYYAWMFFQIDEDMHAMAPTVEYANVNAAITGGATQTLPTGLANQPKTTCLILKGDASALPTAGGDQWIDIRTTPVSSPGGTISDHGNLSGLGDDDHVLYFNIDGSDTMTGTLNMGANTILTTGTIIATSTLTVNASTTYLSATNIDTTTYTSGTWNGTAIDEAYLDTNQTNLIGTGALNSGSITSGFTSIDVGAGAITTTGQLAFGNASGTQLTTTNYTYLATASGRVGIGTTTPLYVLDVFVGVDDIRISGNGNAGLGFLLESTYANGRGWYFNTDPGDGSFGINYAGTSGSVSLPGTEYITTLPSGNVGIGTTSPYAKLSVNGGVVASYFTATSTATASTFDDISIVDLTSTGRLDLGSAVLEIPQDQTSDSVGETDWDTTTGQFQIYGNGRINTFTSTSSKGWNIASTTLDGSGNSYSTASSTFLVQNFPFAITLLGFYCKVDDSAGTATVLLTDGTNETVTAICDTTGVLTLTTTNNTWTQWESFKIEIMTGATTPDRVTITPFYYETAN